MTISRARCGTVRAALASAAFTVLSCGGEKGLGREGCAGACTSASDFLTSADVQRILAQGSVEAQARGARATLAVVDRVGNVLGSFRMNGADPSFRISSGRAVRGGLEDARFASGDALAAIAKAVTGAFLSSEGNAFSTRTASQIIQENFNPREFSQPSGPLYGVQFSQLPCSDIMRSGSEGMTGPRPSPLGLSADPGGLPLYKEGRLVGGVGVISDGLYALDPDITDIDEDPDELIAVGAARGFMAPGDRRGDRITADGRTFRFVDSEDVKSGAATIPALAAIPGATVAVDGFFSGIIRPGIAFRTPESGFRFDTATFGDLKGVVLVDERNQNRFPPRAGSDGLLTANEVTSILRNALMVANRARAQIRRPLGSAAEVTATVVDTAGEVLGLVRTPDAPVFGTDVAAQKARTAGFFSNPQAAAELQTVPRAVYPATGDSVLPGSSVTLMRQFLNDPTALSNGLAYSARAIGNLHRPFFPDGVAGRPPGPFSPPYSNWSPFHVGLQLDLVINAVSGSASGVGCAFLPKIRNGIQIFPGAVPIYRGSQLVGAIGVSGDGVDQDDMIAFLGLANAGVALKTGIANAPRERRADLIEPFGLGTRLRYVQCPQAPFNDSTEHNVCADF